jgi:hypothetical protein
MGCSRRTTPAPRRLIQHPKATANPKHLRCLRCQSWPRAGMRSRGPPSLSWEPSRFSPSLPTWPSRHLLSRRDQPGDDRKVHALPSKLCRAITVLRPRSSAHSLIADNSENNARASASHSQRQRSPGESLSWRGERSLPTQHWYGLHEAEPSNPNRVRIPFFASSPIPRYQRYQCPN